MADLLSNKVALITGAAHPKGIGRAIAKAFEREGALAIISDLADAEGMREAAGLACDVADPAQARSVVEQVLARHGQLDVLVNNAGVGVGSGDFLKLTDQDWELSFSVNLRGIVNLCRAAIPSMLGKGGAIINVASLAGLGAAVPIPACYTASKFAAIGLTKQLAVQFAKDGIRCNALCPGSVLTQMHDKLLDLMAESGLARDQAHGLELEGIPLGRSAEPEDIGDAAVYLASDLARYVTGVALPVAGGMSPGL